MLTIKQLSMALQQLDAKLLNLPVRLVQELREVERGPLEGAFKMQNKPVVGVALTQEGLFLFIQESDEDQKENYLAGLPPGFQTGNIEIDNRLKGIEPGDEWKNG
jgi:hypothetical protein